MNRNREFAELLKYYGTEKFDRSRGDRMFDRFKQNAERYFDKVELIKNNPDLVILEEGIDGIGWAHKNSPEGKKHLRKLEIEHLDAENHADMMANITEHVADELLDKDVVTKINIRQSLDKYGKFSVENMKKVVEILTDEGIEVF
jgi:hypothetical protein